MLAIRKNLRKLLYSSFYTIVSIGQFRGLVYERDWKLTYRDSLKNFGEESDFWSSWILLGHKKSFDIKFFSMLKTYNNTVSFF